MSSQRLATYFVPATGITWEVITADISSYLGNDALVKPGQHKNQKGELVLGYFIVAYRALTSDQLADIKTDSARWEAEKAKNQTNRRSQDRDVGYHNSLTSAQRLEQPPRDDDAAPPQGGYSIPSQYGDAGPHYRPLEASLGISNSKQRSARPSQDKAAELSGTAFPSSSTADRQSNQFQSNAYSLYGAGQQSNGYGGDQLGSGYGAEQQGSGYGTEQRGSGYGAEQQSSWIDGYGAEQQSSWIDESLPRHYYNAHEIPRRTLHDHQQTFGAPTIAKQAPHSQLLTTFSTPTGPATPSFYTSAGAKLSAGLGIVAASAVAALALSQPSELQPAKSPTISDNREYISDNATLSVSNFELFDDQTPPGNVADKADRWFRCLRDDFVLDLPEKSILDKKDRIRIAVLDTGICEREKFKGTKRDWKRITYKSFVTGDPNPTEPSDPDGHGTHVALLLLRVAQNADIYMAKISGEDGLHKPNDIADAIRYAVNEWKVHIISMSFGFDGRTPGINCIGDEIRFAHYMKTVVFAAAHNQGGRMAIAYPASLPEVICINSTNGDGTPSSFNPSPKEGKNFSTLGEGVPSHNDITKRLSGTSYATSITAGMAAVVMDYMAQKSRGWADYKIRREAAERIMTKEGIIKVFDECFSEPRGGFKYLFPWKCFKKDQIGLDMVLLNKLENLY